MRLEVVTPRGSLLATDASEVTAPGLLGEFGVLPGHIPFLTALKPGVVTYASAAGAAGGKLAVGAGYAEVSHDRVTILADVGARLDQIDVEEARSELADANRQLEQPAASDDAGLRARLELQRDWAQARLDAVGATPAH